MMKKICVCLAAAAILSGCGAGLSKPDTGYKVFSCSPQEASALVSRYGPGAEFGCLMYGVAGKLIVITNEPIVKNRPILVTTLVSIDDYKQSSALGRSAGQLVASRLAQLGYTVQDVTFTGALTVDPKTGETVLSRDIKQIGQAAQAQAVVAGTYAVVGQKVYLNIRLLRADNGVLLSSTDVALPADVYDPAKGAIPRP